MKSGQKAKCAIGLALAALAAGGGALALGCGAPAEVRSVTGADDLLAAQVRQAATKLQAHPIQAGKSFDFAMIGDSRGGLDVLKGELEEINQLGVALVLYTGDLVPSGREEQYKEGLAVLNSSMAPVFPALGNHERLNGGIKWYIQYFGRPTDYSFDYGDWHFTSLDNSTAAVSDSQMIWLKRELGKGKHKVVFAHEPPPLGSWVVHSFIGNALEFEHAVEGAKTDACIFGHLHIFDATRHGGVQYMVSGGGGAPLAPIPWYHSKQGGAYFHYTIGHAGPDGATFDVHKFTKLPARFVQPGELED